MKNILLKEFYNLSSSKKIITKITSSKEKLYAPQLPRSYKSLIINKISDNFPVICLLPDIQTVNEFNIEFSLLGRKNLVKITRFEDDSIQTFITKLSTFDNPLVISTYDLLKIKLPPQESLSEKVTVIEEGGSMSYDDLVGYLNLLDYDKQKYVDSQGSFAIRGSIIDFWSYSEEQPCRLEFDGDFLESIRYFDYETQRSTNKAGKVTLAVAITDEDETSCDIFDYIENAIVFCEDIELKEINSSKKEKINSEVLDEELKEELFDGLEKIIEEAEPVDEFNFDFEQAIKKSKLWLIEEQIKNNPELDIKITEAPAINSSYQILKESILNLASGNYKIFFSTENELHQQRIENLLKELDENLSVLIESKKLVVNKLPIYKGFVDRENKFAVLTDYEVFNKPYRSRLQDSKRRKKKGSNLGSLNKGDYVVHENYGIGRYEGLETIKIGMVDQECIKIIYAENDVVYVNLNYLSLVKKFSDKDNATPTLSKLGSNEWKNTKNKVKKKIQDAARDLIKLYAQRKASVGFAFSPDTIWQKELEASFFYEDTPDQSKVTDEVKVDMESENPMDRLVCGDVGFGKTEVAVRAAFKAVNDGKQVAILVPTTILAEQHFNTFKDRLAQFPVKVRALSRFRKKSHQEETLKGLLDGSVDVVVGTHRLLSKDVKFKDLGLLIIDEEQRFGVMAKEKLRKLKANVDTLTMTATPIPRTLNLSLLGARDLSIISTPPPNRQPIYTKVEVFDIQKIREWILDEIKRDGQVFFVHDRVQSIEKIGAYLLKHIPEIDLKIAHGQMKPAELEKVIYDFMNKKYNVLLATKIIESGIDIPNVNTIIVNRADRFGLAELHQLRGRVGRSNKKAFAYFIVPSMKSISKKAIKRLQAIEEHSDIGEGFNLSMRDLEIRGAGNLLGTEQSGAINTVGFDMYVKLLDEAVEELKQNEFKDIFKNLPVSEDRTEPTIDTFFEIGIPKDYMPEQADRLSYYTSLFTMLKEDDSKQIVEEIKDKFGKLPGKVELLVQAAILRFYASFAMFERIVIKENEISFILPGGNNEEFYKNKFKKLMSFVMEKYSRDIQFKQTPKVMKLVKQNRFKAPKDMLKNTIDFCKIIKRLYSGKSES